MSANSNSNSSSSSTKSIRQSVTESAEHQQLSGQLSDTISQLDTIRLALESSPDNEDLLTLQSSLEELQSLLEFEILQLKVKYLLGSNESSNSETKSDDDNSSTITSLVAKLNNSVVSVPFTLSSSGPENYFDAILSLDEDSQEVDSLHSLQFRAFFLYPLVDSMLTCQFYLKDSCRFSASGECKFSHGILVNVDQLSPKISYTSEDQERPKPGNNGSLSCLVPHSALSHEYPSDKLWSQAEVVRTNETGASLLIRLVKDRTDHWVPNDEIVLVDCDFALGNEESEGEEQNIVPDLPFEPESSTISSSFQILTTHEAEFGEWERFTNGIGSKLLAKMGYKAGTGLGSLSQGMITPISAFVYPPGRSLDSCFQLRAESEAKKMNPKDILKEKARKRRIEEKQARQYAKEEEKIRRRIEGDSAFQFVNNMFKSSSSSKHQSKPSTSSSSMKSLSSSSLTLSSFKVDEELRKAEADLKKVDDSLARNVAGKADRSVVRQLQEKRDQETSRVESLKRRQAEFGREQTKRQDKEKLRFF